MMSIHAHEMVKKHRRRGRKTKRYNNHNGCTHAICISASTFPAVSVGARSELSMENAVRKKRNQRIHEILSKSSAMPVSQPGETRRTEVAGTIQYEEGPICKEKGSLTNGKRESEREAAANEGLNLRRGSREGRIFNGSYWLSLVQGNESSRREKTNEHGDLERISKTGDENLIRRKKMLTLTNSCANSPSVLSIFLTCLF
jgi:hypothetical protein